MSYEIFESLLKERGLTVYAISKKTGISTATFSNWKAGRYTPKADKRRVLADALGVSLEYLDSGDEALRDIPAEIDKAAAVDPDLKELFSLAQKATPEQRAQAVRIFHALIGDYDGKDNYSTD